jgi:NAD(P)H-flavin reductase
MWQLTRAIFKNPDDKTKVTLVFGNVTEEDILLKKEFDKLESDYPNQFRAFYVLDNPPEGWKQGKGFVSHYRSERLWIYWLMHLRKPDYKRSTEGGPSWPQRGEHQSIRLRSSGTV